MADLHIGSSMWVALLTIILVVVGLIYALLWYFKRADCLTEEDRLHIEKAKVAWIGATALGVLALVAHKRDGMRASSGSASLI